MKGLGLLSAPLDDQGLTTQHYSLFNETKCTFISSSHVSNLTVCRFWREQRGLRGLLCQQHGQESCRRGEDRRRRREGQERRSRGGECRPHNCHFFSTNIICDKYELWVSAVLVLKDLRESKMAFLFWPFQLIWTWGHGASQVFFCKHKQMGLNEIIHLQKSSYLLHLLSYASWFLQLQFHWWQSNFRMLRGRTRWPTWRPPLPASLARPTSSEHLSTLN